MECAEAFYYEDAASTGDFEHLKVPILPRGRQEVVIGVENSSVTAQSVATRLLRAMETRHDQTQVPAISPRWLTNDGGYAIKIVTTLSAENEQVITLLALVTGYGTSTCKQKESASNSRTLHVSLRTTRLAKCNTRKQASEQRQHVRKSEHAFPHVQQIFMYA